MKFSDDFIVVRVVLKPSTGVDDAGDAEAVELAHELARRIQLVLVRELRPFGKRGIENHGIGAGDEQPGGVPLLIPLNLAAGWVGRVFGIADGAQGRAVQPGAVVEVQDKHGGVGRHSIDFFQSRHAALGELELGPAADHSDPLRGRRARGLILQAAQRVRQGGHPVPTQLQVVVEATADRMHVGIIEAGNDGPTLAINYGRCRPTQPQNLVTGASGTDFTVLDSDCLDKRRNTICSDLGVMQYDFGWHRGSFSGR